MPASVDDTLLELTRDHPVGRRLLALFRPYRGRVAVGVLLVVAQIALSSVSPILLRSIVDDALPHRKVHYLVVLCLAMFAASVLAIGLGVVQAVLLNTLTQRIVHTLRVAVYDRVQAMQLSFFLTQPMSEVETRIISDIGGVSSAVSLTAQSMIAASIQVVAAMAVMLYMNWLLAVIVLGLGLLLSVVTERAARRRRTLAAALQQQTSQVLFVVGEDLTSSGVLLGRTLGRHGWQRRRFAEASRRLSRLSLRQLMIGKGLQAGVAAVFAALPPLLYLLAGTAVAHISIGTIVVLITLQARLNSPLQQLLGFTSSWAAITAMLQRTFAYVDMRPEIAVPGRHRRLVTDSADLSTVHLGLTYAEAPQPALADVSVTFPARTLTLVVGPSGSGKSTLALLLAGQLLPTRGEIRYGDTPLAPEDLWRHVTLVPQETILFNTTLRENLLFADPYADEQRLLSALHAAGLSDWYDALPNGLDTEVGEGGHSLSGGERQRAGLARALLDSAPVLVVDEPTSALDNETSAYLHQVLGAIARQRTVVFITHRLPAVAADQRVVVLNEGAVEQAGTHAQLLAAGGSYARYVELAQASVTVPAGTAGVSGGPA
jgi:ATP-binding cassette subfamily B protein